MKIKLVIELDERCRLAIAARTGKTSPATYEECAQELYAVFTAHMEVVTSEYDRDQEEKG